MSDIVHPIQPCDMSKDWSGGWCPPGGCCEEWSVHAHLTLNPQQAGNITVTTEGARGDSGYGSEKGVSTPTARATCSVTLGGHHTVTLTCAEIPIPTVPPQQRERWVFCNQHDKQRTAAAPPPAPPQPPPPPVYKDAASQTSTSHIPQILSPQPGPAQEPKHHLDTRTKVSISLFISILVRNHCIINSKIKLEYISFLKSVSICNHRQ